MANTLSHDFIKRFSFDQLNARGCYVRLEQTILNIQETHHYPKPLAKLLNQFAVSAVLLRDSVKLDGNLTIQYGSDDAISLIVADCSTEYGTRAVCEYDAAALAGIDGEIDLQTLSSNATLTITISPKNGNRYQGVVAIEASSLAECLQDYFLRSEQLPSRFVIMADSHQGVGISLYALPEQDSEIVAILKDDWQRLNFLMDTLKEDEMRELDVNELLRRLFHEEQCRSYEEKSVRFQCDCSRERSAAALKSLGVQELENIKQEQETISIDCHFCFQRYEFNHHHIDAMLNELV